MATMGVPEGAVLGTGHSPFPREIIKWLMSLDLSFSVKNPKRDFSNGFLVAEILSRYYSKDVDILSFENGLRLAAKIDNWEQIYRLFKKRDIMIGKADIDPVIHCAPGAAEVFVMKLHHALTKRNVKAFPPKGAEEQILPAFMRDTASKRLKDTEIARIQDDVERTIRAIDCLGGYHDERRHQKAHEAPLLIQEERRLRLLPGGDHDASSKEEVQDSLQLSEVRVKALTGSAAALQGKGQKAADGKAGKSVSSRQQLLKAVSTPASSVGALAGMQAPALFVKPAADIMRPLVLSIVQESEELSKVIDTRKDVVVSFMEQCRDCVPDHQKAAAGDKLREIEETSVRVFETLANRAQLLVDTLTKSPPEFWKVWSTFYPALTDFSEASPVFESAVFFFKRLGDLMREADPPLTQQLITEVGLPALAKELCRAPEKRECLCEIIYSYTQEDTLNHLLVLRALKEKVGDNLPVYVSCLACLISVDAQLSLLDEHLLDLYIYYALMAMQSQQPRVRVAGVCILSTITTCSSQHRGIVALIPQISALATDDWWEVQAQLLLLSAHLLSKLAQEERQDGGSADEGSASAHSHLGDNNDGFKSEVAQDELLAIISRLFVVSASKNVLQVGLSALVHLLPDFPTLLPMFVTVLLEQPPNYRQRLLRPSDDEARGFNVGRLTYVIGNLSRMYEEKCVSQMWNQLDVAKTLVMQLEARPVERLQPAHLEVLLASLPEQFEGPEAEEWLRIFDKVKAYVFDAFLNSEMHLPSAQMIKHFWTRSNEDFAAGCIETSKHALLRALQTLYAPAPPVADRVEEAAVLQFLKDLLDCGGMLKLEVTSVLESFREILPAEFDASSLSSLLPPPS